MAIRFCRTIPFLVLFFARALMAFPAVEILEISPVLSLPRAIHHGILVKIKPITDTNLLGFKVEVSKNNGATWRLYDNRLRAYDHRHLILPYRNEHFGFVSGQNYQVRICAEYGSSSSCAVSAMFQFPHIAAGTEAEGTRDSDDDILTDEREYNLGSDPRNPDSDQDQMADSYETARNLDPNLTQKPFMTVSATTLDFGPGVPSGMQLGQHKLITIFNEGQRVLRISNGIINNSASAHYHYLNRNFEVEIIPGSQRTIAIDFLPTAVGNWVGTLDILSDDAAHFPLSISLSGTATKVANFRVESEARLTFPATAVGQETRPKSIRISNPNSDSVLDAAAFVRHSLNFLVMPSRFRVPPGGEITVDVIFSPEWSGSYEGLVEIRAGNAAGQNFTQIPVVASATGASPRLRMGASSINFGTKSVGGEVRKQLIIFNDGDGVLYVKHVDFGSGSHSVFFSSSENVVVPPHGSNRIEISFRPKSAENFVSQLCLVTNDTRSTTSMPNCWMARPIGQGLYWPQQASAGVSLSGTGR